MAKRPILILPDERLRAIAEPIEKIPIAQQKIRRAPKRSASQPLTGRKTARLSRYEVIARLRCSTCAFSDRAMAGRAVAITDVSRFCRNNGQATTMGTIR